MKKENGRIIYSDMSKKTTLLFVCALLFTLCACVSPSSREEEEAPEEAGNKEKTETTVKNAPVHKTDGAGKDNKKEAEKVSAENKEKTPPPLTQKEKWEQSIRGSYGSWQPGKEENETGFSPNTMEVVSEEEIFPAAPAVSGVMPTPAEQAKKREKRPSAVHTVVKGETLWGIAAKYYGKGWKWEKIRQANRDRLKKDTIINPGLTLVIPAVNEEESVKKEVLPEKNMKQENMPVKEKEPAKDNKQGNTESHTGNTK